MFQLIGKFIYVSERILRGEKSVPCSRKWSIYSATLKNLHFENSPHIHISKYFQGISYLWIAIASTNDNNNKICRYSMQGWAEATFVKLTKLQAWQELIFDLALAKLRVVTDTA